MKKDCLELFLRPERISIESGWKCNKCQVCREAAKKIDLWRLPQILIIQLKRFDYFFGRPEKINTFVDFPIEMLNLNQFVRGKQEDNCYQLYAVTNHLGTMNAGHYWATCRYQGTNQWYYFDDTVVREVKAQERHQIVSSNAYILFYSRLNK